jgi:hypothetical protein
MGIFPTKILLATDGWFCGCGGSRPGGCRSGRAHRL